MTAVAPSISTLGPTPTAMGAAAGATGGARRAVRVGVAILVTTVLSGLGVQPGQAAASGTITEFPIPTPNSDPRGITIGPDGNLWFTERDVNKIGRITTSGAITEFLVPTPASEPTAITVGPDRNLWFTENDGNKIGRLYPGGW